MVILSRILGAKVTRKYLRQGFRDTLAVYVAGGCGGNGLPKFGGIGGQGGNVKVIARENITLEDVYRNNKTKQFIAKNGRNASHNFILGVPGEDISIEVPVGVTIHTELGKKIGELNKEGEEIIIAKGGTGGHPKNGYLGTKGQMYPIKFDLKLIADIGLVGFPNAGKSTILNSISHAKSKIASYPFTTVKPHLGIVKYKDLRQISMADLPGLIEGAFANKGMGHSFLKHLERTKLLLVIVDINGFQLSHQYPLRNCLETVMLLNRELELYNEDFLNKPSMLVVNKMDTDGARQKYEEIKDHLKNLAGAIPLIPEELRPKRLLKFECILPISAKESKEDIEKLKQLLRILLDSLYVEEDQEELQLKSANLYNELKSRLKERGPRLV